MTHSTLRYGVPASGAEQTKVCYERVADIYIFVAVAKFSAPLHTKTHEQQ